MKIGLQAVNYGIFDGGVRWSCGAGFTPAAVEWLRLPAAESGNTGRMPVPQWRFDMSCGSCILRENSRHSCSSHAGEFPDAKC
jgi:hypothetical protein